MLKIVGIVLVVALILVGALMPLKYTARMQLPKPPTASKQGQAADEDEPGDGGG